MNFPSLSDLRERLNNQGWRGFLIMSYLLVIAVFVVLWVWLLMVPLQRSSIEEQRASLSAVAASSAYVIEISEDEDPQTIVERIAQHGTLRITIIRSDGKVLADSHFVQGELDNHLERPEVQGALKNGYGESIRSSDNENIQRMYVATTYDRGGEIGVIRVSEEMSILSDAAKSAQRTGVILLILGLVAVSIVAFTTLKRATKPVGHLERVRTDFVANASHELKTPVAGIRLLAESLEVAAEDKDYPIVKDFSKRLSDEALRLQTLVTDLLDLSRLEQGSGQRPGEVDLHTIMSASIESRRPAATEKGLFLKFNDRTPQGISTRVSMPSSDASLIIDNLIDNAIRYSEKGGITVNLYCEKRNALIQVSDTGIGLSSQEIPRIFERFYRVDVARSREAGGTGLGLSLVRHAVLKAHGTIEVDSTPGEGSTFNVRIPK